MLDFRLTSNLSFDKESSICSMLSEPEGSISPLLYPVAETVTFVTISIPSSRGVFLFVVVNELPVSILLISLSESFIILPVFHLAGTPVPLTTCPMIPPDSSVP